MNDTFAQALSRMRYRLKPDDRERYERLFAATDRREWELADAIAAQIKDRRLIGYSLAAQYLSPLYRANFSQLRGWLDLYSDLPQAPDIYRLAKAERPIGGANDLPPPKPVAEPRFTARFHRGQDGSDASGSTEPQTAAGAQAATLFFAGDDKGALADATRATNTLGGRASMSHWIAGLAAWRLGMLAEAERHFIALAQSRTASGWMRAGGAYWAGRVEDRLSTAGSGGATRWFVKASHYSTTFYGLLAMRKLGLDIVHEISTASLKTDYLNLLAERPAGYRALALLEIGRRDLAAEELKRIDPAGDPAVEQALLVVADAAHLPQLSASLAERMAAAADPASVFPIPSWRPRNGFRVDPALLFAVARQESAFDPRARSPAGAAGLMQLMPRTAEALGGARASRALFDPATNLELGQRYLTSLMGQPEIGGNLLLVALAYNTGAGNLSRYQNALRRGDPLLAMESISCEETRGFAQRVLANYWIYQAKLGHDSASLTDLAEGRWPRYRWGGPMDGAALAAAD